MQNGAFGKRSEMSNWDVYVFAASKPSNGELSHSPSRTVDGIRTSLAPFRDDGAGTKGVSGLASWRTIVCG
jgi:hypothetical protein